jgi:hypothetical protein
MHIKYVVQNVSNGRPRGLLSSSSRWNLKSILRSYYFSLPFDYDAFYSAFLLFRPFSFYYFHPFTCFICTVIPFILFYSVQSSFQCTCTILAAYKYSLVFGWKLNTKLRHDNDTLWKAANVHEVAC